MRFPGETGSVVKVCAEEKGVKQMLKTRELAERETGPELCYLMKSLEKESSKCDFRSLAPCEAPR